METLDGLNVVFAFKPDATMFGITEKQAKIQALAEQYAIVADELANGGIIVYAKYNGKWSPNPWSTRWLIRILLLNMGIYLPPIKETLNKNMNGYLGETELEISETQYRDYTPSDWAMMWIEMYSGIDGSHHKDWLIDQVARILKGTKVVVKVAKWENGHTAQRFTLGEPPSSYWDWVKEMEDGEDGPNTYIYNFGVAP